MISLFTSIYTSKDPQRNAEYKECLERNLEVFDRVFVLNEDNTELEYNSKLYDLPITNRPTFRTFFNTINQITGPDDINVIANSDIYFEPFDKFPSYNECFALTRWEGEVFLNRQDSQDSWLFRGKIPLIKYAEFCLGRPGCDNRIAWELKMAGYMVSNPSLTIITRHVHKHPTDHSKAEKRIGQPYFKPIPCT